MVIYGGSMSESSKWLIIQTELFYSIIMTDKYVYNWIIK